MIKDAMQKRRLEVAEKLRKSFSAIIDDQPPAIGLADFEKDWLNMFFGQPVEGETIPILSWVHRVSGSPYQRVNVVSGGTRYRVGNRILVKGGTLEFVVPPIFNGDAIDIKQPGSGYFELIMELKDRTLRHSAEGDRFMQATIEPLFTVKENNDTYVEQMDIIARRYGFPTIGKPTVDSNISSESVNETPKERYTSQSDF